MFIQFASYDPFCEEVTSLHKNAAFFLVLLSATYEALLINAKVFAVQNQQQSSDQVVAAYCSAVWVKRGAKKHVTPTPLSPVSVPHTK